MPEIQSMTHSAPVTEERTNKSLEYNGKVQLQIPRSLHHKLNDLARAEGVPLEQFILYKLTEMAE